MRLRAVFAAIAIHLAVFAPGAGAQSQNLVDVTPDQARALAAQALSKGLMEQARQIAMGLLQADPKDAYAYFVLAQAHAALGDPKLGRTAAKFSYRYSDNENQKYQTAHMAAQLSYAADQFSRSQIWLRRAALHANTDAQIEKTRADYRLVRARNPWAGNLRFSLVPSSNVNGGATDAYNVIDGVPIVGILSGSAQALSGTIGTLDLIGSYRLAQSKTSLTTLGGRLFIKRVALSGAARALAPTVRNSDFATTVAEGSVRHIRQFGKKGNTISGDLAIGQAWAAGDQSFRFARLRGDRVWEISPSTAFGLNLGIEGRDAQVSREYSGTIYTVGGFWGHRLSNGDQLSFAAAIRDVHSDDFNAANRTTSARLGYQFGKAVGPVKITAGLGLGETDYDQYRIGFITVPGGRQDHQAYADMTFLFHKADYAGFAPTLTVRLSETDSNVSRFDTRELSVSFGIQSTF